MARMLFEFNTELSHPMSTSSNFAGAGGIGDKRLLRAALRDLGLPRAAARVKRAIQFGSRLGKLSNVQHFGSNRGANARHAGVHEISTDA